MCHCHPYLESLRELRAILQDYALIHPQRVPDSSDAIQRIPYPVHREQDGSYTPIFVKKKKKKNKLNYENPNTNPTPPTQQPLTPLHSTPDKSVCVSSP